MKNALQRGEIVPITESLLTHPTHADGFADAGDLVFVGGLFGIALESAAADTDIIRVAVTGVVNLVCAASTATANSAIAVGNTLYYSDGDVAAVGTVTTTGTAPANSSTIVIGDVTYTFKSSLSTGPTVPYEVLIGVSAAVSLDNLKSAINATTGGGSTYSTGTVIHPTVTATTNEDTTQVVEAKVAGGAGNSIVTPAPSTSPDSHLSWGATTLVTGALIGEPNKDTGKVSMGVALGVVAVGAGSKLIPVKLKRTF